jgi:hypothetical protein
MDKPYGNPPPGLEGQDQRHQRRIAWGWWFFAGAALFYLLAEHRAHFFGILARSKIGDAPRIMINLKFDHI